MKTKASAFWIFSLFLLAFAHLRDELTSAGITSVFPGDQSYVSASASFNKRFHFQPAAITYPRSTLDVSEIVRIGTRNNVGVAARSGGHSFIADGVGGRDGVVVVDLRNMTRITIDTVADTAVIETGNRLGDIVVALNNAGRGLGHGSCPDVGIGGHAGYGGFGFTSRMWGLALDSIQSIDVVLSNGSVVEASNQHNVDLFWAMRGSAPSFGIATSIRVKTYPVPPSVTVFSYSWNASVAEVTRSISATQTFSYTDISPKLGILVFIHPGPTSKQVFLQVTGAWYGDPHQFNATISPLLQDFPANPVLSVESGTYIQSAQRLAGQPLNELTPPDTFYAKSLFTPEKSPMTNASIDAFVNYFARDEYPSNLRVYCSFELYGGTNSAVNAVPPNASSYAHRSSLFLIQIEAFPYNHKPPFPSDGIAFVDAMMNSIISNNPPSWDYGAYPNYADDHLEDREYRYYGSHYRRLQFLKHNYDASNTFLFPIGIQPVFGSQNPNGADGSQK